MPTTTRTPRPARVHGRRRRGFTIIELMVAVMILSIGVIAMASTAAVTGRQMTEGSVRNRAASVAESRFEVLAARASLAGSCNMGAPLGGTTVADTTRRGIREQVTITRPVNDGTLRVSVTLTLPRVPGSMTFQSVVRCN